MMTREEVIEFVTKNPIFGLATVDKGKPRVRNMMLYKAGKDGIVFTTGRDKDVNKQMKANPAVEMCFYSSDENLQVRIEGAVQVVDDLDLKKKIVEDFPFLKPWVEAAGYEIMAVYALKNGKAVTWTMETNQEPKKYIQL